MLTVILTGGQSTRMGRDKALLSAGREPMALMLAGRFSCLGPVVFSVDRAGRFNCGKYGELPDVFPGKGPFNGLYSAFTQTEEDVVFLTATDMPYGDPTLARVLLEKLESHDACVIRRESGYLEPLFAVYRRSCLPFVKKALVSDRNSLQPVFSELSTKYLEENQLGSWDLEQILCNLNTPDAYESYIRKVKKLMKSN